ncbi:MAG: hypothetical protein K2K52_06135, partial [Paramuribaculum sp.]|nr:hypothetical protein [Paramuribaculum sp.]
YLNNSCDVEIEELLGTAKCLEERWREIRSPWYYPRNREQTGETGDFHDIIERCKAYKGERLKDRYALQVARALFASRDFASCIEYYDSEFADIPDSNLMKRMAQRYVAGCWSRLGDTNRADSIFAKAGDIWSLSVEDPVKYMAERNPNAPQLIDYIRNNATDSTLMQGIRPVVIQLLKNYEVGCRGDWYFVMAYIDNEFNNSKAMAKQHIRHALRQRFSSEELENLARTYKMKLDAQTGDLSNLLADLKWMENKTDVLIPDAQEWVKRCQNIIYADWVPTLWRRKDYSTAILLCAYADNLAPENYHERWNNITWYAYWAPDKVLNTTDMRDSEEYINQIDYGCLSFQMMGSLSSTQLASTYNRILTNTPLYTHLRRKARTDKDYFNELIGTLALREENYSRAVTYLSKVSEHYLKTMNIDKGGYLNRTPFTPYPSRWELWQPSCPGAEAWEFESQTKSHPGKSNPNAKLHFARKMLEYKQQMMCGKTPDDRGLARMMYAIGRRNSFEECWALTQYWRGGCTGIFEPDLQYWEDDFAQKSYAFLFDYEKTIGHKTTERIYEEELKAALDMITTDDAKAKAHLTLNNLKTIVKYYGDTSTGRYIKSECDNWQSWL